MNTIDKEEPMNEFRKFIAITKVDAARREVYGVVTSEAPDKDGEICDYPTTAPLYRAWSAEFASATEGRSLGNLREMHTQSAVGKITALDCNDEAKTISVRAQVVDDDAWKKCEAGVYTGFSHGGRYLKTWLDDAGEYRRYTAEPSEISLVDNPCNPEAHFEYVKADGTREVRKFSVPSTQFSVGVEDQSPVAGSQSPAGVDGMDNMDEVDAAMGRSKASTAGTRIRAGVDAPATAGLPPDDAQERRAAGTPVETGATSGAHGKLAGMKQDAAAATSEAPGKLAGENLAVENRELREQLAKTEAALVEVNAQLDELERKRVPWKGMGEEVNLSKARGGALEHALPSAKGDKNVLKACLLNPVVS
jgi:hypothetical protein